LSARIGRVPVVAAVVTSIVLASAGCTTARDTLGTNASSCFEALAVAADAVHDRGSFAGVHLLKLSAVGADLGMEAEVMARVGAGVHDICVVSYRGTFRVDQVARPLGPPPAGGHGHFAIVIVSKPQNRLIGTVIRQTQPLRFGHPI
jgi:hypothetical protein